MAVQLQVALANTLLDTYESTIGVSAILKIYNLTAGAPANCAAAITGTVLATLNLPSDWMAAAASGSKAKTGTWEDASADVAGVADFYRLFKSDGTTCMEQGTVTLTGAGGDMTLDNTNITVTQQVIVTGFTKTLPV